MFSWIDSKALCDCFPEIVQRTLSMSGPRSRHEEDAACALPYVFEPLVPSLRGGQENPIGVRLSREDADLACASVVHPRWPSTSFSPPFHLASQLYASTHRGRMKTFLQDGTGLLQAVCGVLALSRHGLAMIDVDTPKVHLAVIEPIVPVGTQPAAVPRPSAFIMLCE